MNVVWFNTEYIKYLKENIQDLQYRSQSMGKSSLRELTSVAKWGYRCVKLMDLGPAVVQEVCLKCLQLYQVMSDIN